LSETVICGFCKKEMKPKRVQEENTVKYWCTECNSLIAAYRSEFENALKLGSLFRRYPTGQYKPKPPTYIKLKEGD